MLYYFRQTRKEILGKLTIALINRVLRLSVETGLICAAVVTVGLVLFAALPHTYWYIFPALTASKLYSNSLLAVSPLVLLVRR